MTETPDQTVLHGSAIAVDGAGCLILGPAGSGKSSLALSLLGLGADLIADDRVILRVTPDHVTLDAPDTLPAAIEARGVGLLNAKLHGLVPLSVVIDMAHSETARLPELKTYQILGRDIRCLHKADTPHFPFAVIHYLRHGSATL